MKLIFKTCFPLSLILPLTFLIASVGYTATVEECLMCHGDKSLTKTDSAGKEKSLFMDESIFTKSVHKDLGCDGCHQGVLAEPHAAPPEPVDCGSCHSDAISAYQAGVHGQKKLAGVSNAPVCKDCHSYHGTRKTDDPEADTYRGNQPQMCAKCHAQARAISKYQTPKLGAYQDYIVSAHGKALKEGSLGVAVCSDCHKSHDIKSGIDPTSPTYHANVPSTCGQCHPMEQEEYGQDAHGNAVKFGYNEAPVCTDCHTDHAIKSSKDPASSTFPANISMVTCNRCHSEEKIIQKYGKVSQRVTRYLDTYHGVGSRSGDTTTASCVSCHTSHNIRPESDPISSINKANLPQTCGKCHKGAGANYTKGSIHIDPTTQKDVVVYWVRKSYLLLIIMTIGGMLAHNAVIMVRFARERYREAKSGRVVRWMLSEILWHFLLIVSFTTLVITGFAFRYPDSWWSSWMTHSPTAFAARGVAHRVAGVIFVGLFGFTFLRAIFTRRGWQQINAKFPVLFDVNNLRQNILSSLGLVSRHLEFDRYDYTEKAEFWALMWGGFVMVITGLILWFETFFLGFIPKWLLDASKAVHFYEAWLASLAILVWHFFFMILHPENYPINFTVLTGTMTEEAYLERHPKDYEKMIARGELLGEENEEPTAEKEESDDERIKENL